MMNRRGRGAVRRAVERTRMRASTAASSASSTRSILLRRTRSAKASCSTASFSTPSGLSSSRCCTRCLASTTVRMASRRSLAWSSSCTKKVCATGAGGKGGGEVIRHGVVGRKNKRHWSEHAFPPPKDQRPVRPLPGSASPVVSMRMASKAGPLRSSSAVRMRMRSPRTVQQMQPLFISITSSSPKALLARLTMASSTPTSPYSFSITAMRFPCCAVRMWFSSVCFVWGEGSGGEAVRSIQVGPMHTSTPSDAPSCRSRGNP